MLFSVISTRGVTTQRKKRQNDTNPLQKISGHAFYLNYSFSIVSDFKHTTKKNQYNEQKEKKVRVNLSEFN